MATVLDDSDIQARLSATDAVRWMGEAIDAVHRGELVAPPRVHANLGGTDHDGTHPGGADLAFTAGRMPGSWFGYRSYATLPADQLVAVWDEPSGQVRAIAIGAELGARRVGAIGAVAADALAAPDAGVVAVIGTGTQAWYQLWALAAVRHLREVRVFSRDPARRAAFARRLTAVPARVADGAKAAVEGAGIVILATDSPRPVIEADWIGPGTYVSTLGPKQLGRAEFGLDLPAAAALLVTDSPAQLGAYDPPNLLAGTPHEGRLVSLGAVRAGQVASTGAGALFFSVGLAGTEAFLLDRLTATG